MIESEIRSGIKLSDYLKKCLLVLHCANDVMYVDVEGMIVEYLKDEALKKLWETTAHESGVPSTELRNMATPRMKAVARMLKKSQGIIVTRVGFYCGGITPRYMIRNDTFFFGVIFLTSGPIIQSPSEAEVMDETWMD